MNVNRIIFAGNFTRDPELRKSSNGEIDIVNFGMACNEYAGKDKPKRATFIECVAFGSTAMNITKFFKKGSAMLFFGRIDYSTWKNDEGKTRTKIAFVVEKFEFVGERTESSSTKSDHREASF